MTRAVTRANESESLEIDDDVEVSTPGKQTAVDEDEDFEDGMPDADASLFAGAEWESAEEDGVEGDELAANESDETGESEVEADESGDRAALSPTKGGAETDHKDGVATAAKANSNPYTPGGNRPHVLLKKKIKGKDGDGQPMTLKKGSKPAVSAVAGNTVMLYVRGGVFMMVKKSALKKAVSSPSNLARALRIRKLKTRKKSKPPAGIERTVMLPPNRGEGWKPPHTGGESLTGRDSGLIWGVTNETGADGSGTGYVAMPMRTGSKFRVIRENTNPTPWVQPSTNTMGKAVWAHGWALTQGKWVKQVMVARIVPDDPSKPPIVFLP